MSIIIKLVLASNRDIFLFSTKQHLCRDSLKCQKWQGKVKSKIERSHTCPGIWPILIKTNEHMFQAPQGLLF